MHDEGRVVNPMRAQVQLKAHVQLNSRSTETHVQLTSRSTEAHVQPKAHVLIVAPGFISG